MSWPTRRWNPSDPNADDAGMAPFTPPLTGGAVIARDAGLPDNWNDYDIKGVSVWDALDNPLYAVAAEAKGIDWEDFKSRVNTQIGPEDDYEFEAPTMVTIDGSNSDNNGRPNQTPGYTFNSTAWEAAMDEWNNDEDAGADEKPNKADFTDDSPVVNKYGFSGTTGTIYGDMDKMYKWLDDVGDEVDDAGDYALIEEGPQGSDYGIEGDIWSHYGLDKPPTGPVTLADSHFSHKDSIRMPGIEWQDPNHPNPYSQYHTDGTVHAGLKDTWINAAIDLGSDSSMTIDEAFDKA